MTEPTISVRTYVIVCALLILLTFLTLGISLFPLPGIWHIIFGLSIAFCKGGLVVVFFMHALISPRLYWIVIAVACFWVLILFALTLGDYFSRDMVPFMPGH
jgi:caa(3)-type oxidase subunit IV